MPDRQGHANIPGAHDVWRRDMELHVICNSHLDHEWTHDFQFYRMLTVRFLDSVLEIMDKVPDYQFLLDSQTVPLEDYLEIRPENERRLAELIAARRLWVGPWYTAPDMTCIFGESIIRNLLIGHQIARAFGHVLKEGYTPFGFGQCSQLPQIYAGFGIESIWFYRGVTPDESPGYVFRWQGADGTTALCTRTPRYNYFFGVMRHLANGGGIFDRDFDFASGKKVFHFCDPQRVTEHALVTECRHHAAERSIEALLAELLEREIPNFPGRAIALMNGMDTSMPTLLDDEVLRLARQRLPAHVRIFHSSMPRFLEALRRDVDACGDALPKVMGERRSSSELAPVLGDILTARPEQKRRNARAEIRLQRFAEPLAAIAWLLGDEYPTRYLQLAWKQLLRAQPHDTIGGTGVDQIEMDMLNRLDQCLNICEGLQQFAMARIVGQIDLTAAEPTDQVLVIFNPSPWARTECVEAVVDLPEVLAIENFDIVDLASGQRVDHAVTGRRPRQERVTRDVYDATTSYRCTQVELDIAARDIPPLGYRALALRKSPAGHALAGSSLVAGAHTLENAYLRVTVGPDGSFALEDKERSRCYENLHVFVDRGEVGDPWMSRAPTRDEVVSSRGCRARVCVVHESALRACLKVELSLAVPAGVEANEDRTYTRRSDRRVSLPITSYLTLSRDSRALDIRTIIDNTAKNHVLQVLFPTGLATDTSYSDTPFDIVGRPIARRPGDFGARPAAEPCLRFVGLNDGDRGLAVTLRGVRGYHVTEDDHRAIALTLLRAFDVVLCTVTARWERRYEQEGSHALGRHEIHYGVIPHGGDWRPTVVRDAERVNCSLLIAQTVAHAGALPPADTLLRVEPEVVELSAFKKAEQRDTLVVRLYNPGGDAHDLKLTLFTAVRSARLVNLEEAPLEGGVLKTSDRAVHCRIGPRKILTLEIECA